MSRRFEFLDEATRERIQSWSEAHTKADSDAAARAAYSALLYGLKLAAQAAPDFLWQMDVDAAARLLLERFPPQSSR